jgi:putative ABC transport system permease protein
MSWVEGARVRLRLLFGRAAAEARMEEEFGFHVEMEAERLMREHGLDAREARRRALVAFGGVERHREDLREGRRPAWLAGRSLDFRLGFRMLVKYPGLTMVGGLAMAFAIWVGVIVFQLVSLVLFPTLPLPDGDRIVHIRNWDAAANSPDARALHDFMVWRDALRTVADIGAFRDATRNLVNAGADARSVQVAEVTASAFRIAPAPPLLGRTLSAADEQPGAPPVVVLGYDVWQSGFGGDAGVLGRSVQLGDEYATVVGVMPEGYAFPIAHEVWTPLRLDGVVVAPRSGPGITIFGRLAPGVSYRQAQAELTTLGQRAAVDHPATHEHLRPQVKPYASQLEETGGGDLLAFLLMHVFVVMLLVLICGNVALLLFARAATREAEIVVRSALGASRRRIGVQLFIEALVLGGVAAAIGLAAAQLTLTRWGVEFLQANLGRLPFWVDVNVSPAAVLWAAVLTLLGAVIAGVLPALRVTRDLGSRLRQGTPGSGGMQFGGVWTAVIVAQVAATVAFPAVAYVEQRLLASMRSYQPGFAAEEYLGVRLDMDAGTAGSGPLAEAERRERFSTSLELLRERVAAQPGVRGVAFVDRLPRTYHRERRIELDDGGVAAAPGTRGAASAPGTLAAPSAPGPAPSSEPDAQHEVVMAAVDASYFDVLEAPVLAGRGFGPTDLEPGARAVIVDEAFVDALLRGQNPIGRRLRFTASPAADASAAQETQPWYEVIGVVPELGLRHPAQRGRPAGVYLPTAPGSDGPVNLLVHTRGDPMVIASSIRTLATAVDPTLRVREFQRLDSVMDDVLWIVGLWLRITLVLTAIALLLSLAGIYAVLSFTVSRRTREIGVRVALGADRRRLVTAIFRRPLAQVGLGVVAGGIVVAAGAFMLAGALPVSDGTLSGAGVSARGLGLFAGYIALMFGVCLLACIVPLRRALGVEPTEALRTG